MTLPTSGPISFNDLRVEIGDTGSIDLKWASEQLGAGTAPYSMSELYGLSSGPIACVIDITAGGIDAEESCQVYFAYEQVWKTGGSTPQLGDRFYYDEQLTDPIVDEGGPDWKPYAAGSEPDVPSHSFEMDQDGYIVSLASCS